MKWLGSLSNTITRSRYFYAGPTLLQSCLHVVHGTLRSVDITMSDHVEAKTIMARILIWICEKTKTAAGSEGTCAIQTNLIPY